ncbi:MAG: hypothetical protein WA900_06170 [Casimicrobiaceae bacterium]
MIADQPEHGLDRLAQRRVIGAGRRLGVPEILVENQRDGRGLLVGLELVPAPGIAIPVFLPEGEDALAECGNVGFAEEQEIAFEIH